MLNVNDLTKKNFFSIYVGMVGGILQIFLQEKNFLQGGRWSNWKIDKILPMYRKKIFKQPVDRTAGNISIKKCIMGNWTCQVARTMIAIMHWNNV